MRERVYRASAWPVDRAYIIADAGTGLRLRMGPRRKTWLFYNDRRLHGARSTTCRALGTWPAIGVLQARKAALVEAGRVAAKQITPGKRTAVRLGPALDDYLKHLKAKAGRRGKPARVFVIRSGKAGADIRVVRTWSHCLRRHSLALASRASRAITLSCSSCPRSKVQQLFRFEIYFGFFFFSGRRRPRFWTAGNLCEDHIRVFGEPTTWEGTR